MTVFEPLYSSKIVNKGPKQLKLVLAPAAAELGPAQPQLVRYYFRANFQMVVVRQLAGRSFFLC